MKAPLKRLVVAAMVTKAVCIEMKENKETMTGKELLSVFEGALVPYYFPMEEDMEDRIKSVILMFEKLLHSPDNVDTRDWPTKNMISYMLENA